MALFHCPFCPFEDGNSEMLLQHVGLIHPETDDSPFIVKDSGRQKRRSVGEVKGGAKLRDTASEHGYIECECGEIVLLSEFSSHSDLHLAEGMAFDEAGKAEFSHDTTILSRDQSPFPNAGSFTPDWPANIGASSDGHPSSRPSSKSRPRGTVQKHPYTVKDWANVLLGTNPPPRPKVTRARRRGAKRLGVRYSHIWRTRKPSIDRIYRKQI